MIFGYDNAIYQETNLKIAITHDIATHCQVLITGGSGSGKSYALLYLLGMLLKDSPNTIIYFCDFKNSEDFSFLENYKYYYAGNKCYDGIMDFYRAFSNARTNRDTKTRHILICDEYPSFINYLQMQDKCNKTKLANDILSAISEILMLGRGIKFSCWIITQRADSTLFNNGSRDNFMCIVALGRISREQKGMVLNSEEIPDKIYRQGEGLILADGSPLREIKYPYIADINDWKQHILQFLTSTDHA